MRLRLGAATGFGIGYYLGAKAGKERYVQLNRMLKKVRRSEQVDLAADKAKAVIDLTVERAKDMVDSRFKNGRVDQIDLLGEELSKS